MGIEYILKEKQSSCTKKAIFGNKLSAPDGSYPCPPGNLSIGCSRGGVRPIWGGFRADIDSARILCTYLYMPGNVHELCFFFNIQVKKGPIWGIWAK